MSSSGSPSPRAAERLRARIEELAAQIIDAVIERGECDAVTDIAGEMPSFVIADLLGIPLDDGRRLYHLTETIHAAPDTATGAPNPAAPSMNAPNENAMNIACRRRSSVRLPTESLMISNLPVSTARR